jgi:hypothetical protein
MKKLIAIPAIAVLAAAGAASAAGFTNGVSAGPIQSGDTWDLTCASGAKVVEWGLNDHLAQPNVVNARVRLDSADCAGEALHFLVLTESGTESVRATPGRIASQPSGGSQYARVSFATPVDVDDLNQIRISIDPGHAGITNVLPIN